MSKSEEVKILRAAESYPNSGVIDCSKMKGAGSYDLHFAMVADGRLRYVDEVIDGIPQVPFFAITDRGRAWLAEVNR